MKNFFTYLIFRTKAYDYVAIIKRYATSTQRYPTKAYDYVATVIKQPLYKYRKS